MAYNKKLKELILNLENVSSIHIPGEYVQCFAIKGVTREMAMHTTSAHKMWEERLVCEYFCCEISHLADVAEAWSPKSIGNYMARPFEHIQKYPDICSVTLVSKNTTEEIWVNWKGTNETNYLQESTTKGLALRVEIGKQKERYI